MANLYILDTSTIVYDSNSFKSFKNNTVIIPITVLEELDNLKKLYNETGANARMFIRTLDQVVSGQDISKGILLDHNITLKIEVNFEENKSLGSSLYGDNRILACALAMRDRNKKDKIIIVAKDIALRIRAKALGLNAEDYRKDKYETIDIYNSSKSLVVSGKQINEFYGNKSIEIDSDFIDEHDIKANDFFTLKSEDGDVIDYVRYNSKHKELKEIRKMKSVFGISPKNLEQQFALDLLMDDSIHLAILSGPSGTGKTLLSLAYGLHAIMEMRTRRFERMIVLKPVISVGRELGTLPGDKKDKLEPFLASYRDNLNFLMRNSKTMNKNGKDNIDPYLSLMIENNVIEIEAISYLRGRSLPNSLIIVDEIQNLTRNEIKTVITRIGEGSKLILMGDNAQIDNLQLDSSNTALMHVIEKFKDREICGSVLLKEGERSELATLASQIL